MWSYVEMWESSSHSHPRRGLGFMDEAAEDISCNIMPEPLPTPCIPPLLPPRLRSSSQSTRRHKILFFFFKPWHFFLSRKKKAWRLCCCGQPCGCMRKETHGYHLHKWPAWMCKSQTKYRIWAAVVEQAFSQHVWLAENTLYVYKWTYYHKLRMMCTKLHMT